MSRRSPRTRSYHDDLSEGSDDSRDRSYESPNSSKNDSRYSSGSLYRSRNDSSNYDESQTASNSSFFSGSPDRSNRMYPDVSDLMDESGDSSFTKITTKSKKLYPDLPQESPTYPRNRQRSPLSHETLKSSSSESRESRPSGNISVIQFLCAIVGVLIIICAILYIVKDSPFNSENSKSGFEYFVDKLDPLKHSFPSQTKRFWATVSASARHVYEQQDPCYPSVILMASHTKNAQLSTCLAKKFASIFSSSFGVNPDGSAIGTDVENFKHMDSDKQKLHLDEKMQAAFQRDGGKAFVISNVHSLSPRAALLLHGFCDGDNAPYKDVMIILTFTVDDATVFSSVKEVERHLTDIWSRGLDMDKLSALMSRIANNPVVLMAEEESTVYELCS